MNLSHLRGGKAFPPRRWERWARQREVYMGCGTCGVMKPRKKAKKKKK